MQFSESWLRSFVDPALDSQTLAHELTMAGLEVEELAQVAPPFKDVVVARIVSVQPHPDADRLSVCEVDDGSVERLQIVCGAPNARAGMNTALARVGAELPGGLRIGPVRMRGVASAGMLCSAKELGLSDEHSGILELDEAFTPGAKLRDVLGLDEYCFELTLTPNRADCLSVYGVAREVAALTQAPLHHPVVPTVPVTITDTLPVTIAAPDLCSRFTGRIVRGVNARAATPTWMAERLIRAGQRPVSVLVDISNYVMLAVGQPTHVFDLDHLGGELTVRWAHEGEQLALLNEQTVTLTPNDGVISSADQPVSLAGIMGGASSAVSLDTRNIYVEAAFWWPEAIMGRARNFKLHSEASHRFERGVDAERVVDWLELTTALILEICGGQAGPIRDECLRLPERVPLHMRLTRCRRVLGVEIAAAEIEDIFTRLGFPWEPSDDGYRVTPPAYRFDLQIEEDLIEEVARIYGYERIPAEPPRAVANIRVPSQTLRGPHALRASMVALDYQEVINFSFVDEQWERDYVGNSDPIRLLNPIASHLSVMRSSLMGGLLANVQHNAHHRQTRVRVFELGRVFFKNEQIVAGPDSVRGIEQPLRLGAVAWGPALEEQWGVATRPVDFYDVKRDLEVLLGRLVNDLVCVPEAHPALHPGRSARLMLKGCELGWLGEAHPRWVQALGWQHAPVLFEVDVAALAYLPLPEPTAVLRQPVVVRDLAVLVDVAVSFQSIMVTLERTMAARPELAIIKDIRLFDVWRDQAAQDGQKSLGLRFWLQSPKGSLDDTKVDDCMAILLQALVDHHSARLRT